jgi:uroporphyrinogen decarboxylase
MRGGFVKFEPDYRNIEMAARNQRPPRLPFYEHIIGVDSMERIIGSKFGDLVDGDCAARSEFFKTYGGFFRDHGYDTVSYEVCVTEILPGGGALLGEQDGPIQNRNDFEKYAWADVPRIFREKAESRFTALRETMPAGMKAIGGIGNGVFEISEDLVGYEQLCLMMVDDPDLFADLYRKIGDLLETLWAEFLDKFGDVYVVCRIGDDMGFKSAPLMSPATLKEHVVPQYRRLVKLIHDSGHPFLLHSCGCIFDVMDDLIAAGIDAKHSNEDAIAPYDEWIRRYGGRIGLFGGIDTDRLCRMKPDDIYAFVLEEGKRFRQAAKGYALGSGNSIPGYVSTEAYLAMIRAGERIRMEEEQKGGAE